MNVTLIRFHLLLACLILLVAGCKKERGPLTIRVDQAAQTLNPVLSNGHGPSIFLAQQVFQTLGQIDPKTLEMVPLMVKSLPKVRPVTEGTHQGELAYDFELNELAKWDNGSPVTADDVIFTAKAILHPKIKNDFKGYFEYLTGLEADASNKKKFTVYFRQYYILALETMCQTPIYPAYHYDAGNKLANVPLSDFLSAEGLARIAQSTDAQAFATEFQDAKYAIDPNYICTSGPYRLLNMNEQGSVIVKKANWWGNGLAAANPMLGAYPDTIIYKLVKEEDQVESMLRSGQLDVVGGSFSADKFLKWKSDAALAANYDFVLSGTSAYSRWLLNLRVPLLQEKAVRVALAHVVNYDYFINTVQKGLAVPTISLINSTKPYYAKDLAPYDFNLEKAKQLLQAAGWTDTNGNGIADKKINGQTTELEIKMLATMSLPAVALMAESIEKNAMQAGIKINIVNSTNINGETRERNFESALSTTSIFTGHFDFHQRFHSATIPTPGDNRSGYQSPLIDSLITAHRTTANDAERDALYVALQKQIHADVPEIFLYAPQQRLIVSKGYNYVLSGFRPGYYEHLFQLK